MADKTDCTLPPPQAAHPVERVTQDPKCKSCSYRVYERRASSVFTRMVMVCRHPRVRRLDCESARLGPGAQCGPDAVLWRKRKDV